MNKSSNQIIPFFNAANDIMQPIRLHCKILKLKDFETKINRIKCIDFNPEYKLFHWCYSNEMLNTSYKIKQKTTNNELWILGKIQVENNSVLISVNSIERAILALKFFNSKIDKSILIFETMDFYNKLLEMSETNKNFYSPIELFFVNKPIICDNSTSIIVDEIINYNQKKGNKQKLLEQLYNKMITEQLPEYENFPIYFYEDIIENIESRLFMKQKLAYEHLNGNIKMTMFELIQKLIVENTK